MASNTIVVNILGNTRGLTKSLSKAQSSLGGLENISQGLTGGLKTAAIGVALFGAAAVGAGAVGAASLAAIPAAILGIGVAFAAMNPKVKEAFGNLKTHVVDTMQTLSKPLVAPLERAAGAISKAFDAVAPSLGRMFKAGAPLIDQFSQGLLPVAKLIGPLLERAFAAGVPVLQAFGRAVTPIIKGLDGLFIELGKGTPQFSAFVASLGNGLQVLLPALGRLITALAPIGTTILTAVIPALVSLLDFLSARVGPAFQAVTGFMTNHATAAKAVGIAIIGLIVAVKLAQIALAAFQAIMLVVTVATRAFQVAQAAAAGVMWLVNSAAIGTRIGLAALWITEKAGAVASGIMTAAQWLLNAAFLGFPLVWILAAIAAVIAIVILAIKYHKQIGQVIVAVWNTIKAATVAVWGFIKNLLSTVWSGIKTAAIAYFNGYKSLIVGVWNVIKSVTSTVWNAVKTVVTAAINLVKRVITTDLAAIKAVWSATWNTIKTVLSTIWNGIKTAVTNGIKAVVTLVSGLKGKVLGAIGNAAKWLYSAGVDLIRGMISGVGHMASALASKAKDVVGSAVNAAKGALGIHSPSRVFRKIGIQTVDGLILGLNKNAGVHKAASGLAAAVSKGFGTPVLSMAADLSTSGSGGSNSGNVYNINVNATPGTNKAALGKELVSVITEYEAAAGKGWRQ